MGSFHRGGGGYRQKMEWPIGDLYLEWILSLIGLHSPKILTIHQGLSQGVSSIGNPLKPLTGLNSVNMVKLMVAEDFQQK